MLDRSKFRGFIKKRVLAAVSFLFIALSIAIGVSLVQKKQIFQEKAAGVNSVQTVFVIFMESYGWADIHGSSQATYINSLLPQASYATQYFPPPDGINLSLPQYIWYESGDNFGIADDHSPAVHPLSATDHLVTLLNNAGVSWKGYFEDIPGNNCPTSDVNKYAVRHDPMVYFTDVTSNTAYCTSHIRPFSELSTDLNNHSVSRYNFIVPNTCNDMHDNCGPGAIKQGDTWLQNNLPQILNSQAFQNNGAVFITWDNDDSSMSNAIPMIVLSPLAKGRGYNNSIHYDHGSLLKTVEEIFGVSPILRNAAGTNDLSDLFGTSINGPTNTPTATPTHSPTATPTATPTSPSATKTPTPTPTTSGTINGTNFYVNPSGSDANSGSSTSPFKTLSKAVSVLAAGDTLNISGTFHETFNINRSGTSAKHIVIKGNSAVIDTTNAFGVQVPGSYIDISGLEVEHVTSHGFHVTGQHISLSNVSVHDSVTENSARTASGGWGSGFSIKVGSDDVTLDHVTSYRNYGEGIAITRAKNVTVKNSIFHDNYSSNGPYIDNSVNVTLDSNLSYCSPNSGFERDGHPGAGILIGEESYSGWGAQLTNAKIINNIITGCQGIKFFGSDVGGGLKTALIAFNDIVNVNGGTAVGISGAPSNSNIRIMDNIAMGSVSSGSGVSASNNISSNPGFAAATTLDPNSFKLASNSPAIGGGIDVGVNSDYFGHARGSRFDLGAIQFGSTAPAATPTSTPLPTGNNGSGKTGDINGDGNVNIIDIGIVIDNYGMVHPTNPKADINSDGNVNIVDIGLIIDNYGK